MYCARNLKKKKRVIKLHQKNSSQNLDPCFQRNSQAKTDVKFFRSTGFEISTAQSPACYHKTE